MQSIVPAPAPVRVTGAALLRTASVVAALMACGYATGAAGQTVFDRNANVAVLQRPHPDYQASGIAAGAWLIYPSLSVGAAYDDNIFAAPSNGVTDTIFTIEPKILIQSNWNRHALSLTADANFREYAAHSRENTVEYAFTSTGRLDVQRDFVVNVRAQYQDQVIPRTEAAYVDASLEPLQYQEASGKLELVRTFGNLRLTVGGGAVHDNYLDGKVTGGGVVDEAFRNNTNVSGSVRLDYATSPNLAVLW